MTFVINWFNKIQQYENNEVKINITIIGTADKPWFKADDVCKALGYVRTKKALYDHVKNNYKSPLYKISVPDSELEILYKGFEGRQPYITEAGLYSLIFASKLESAEKFRLWVFENVLPSIRKEGQYKLERDINTQLSIKEKSEQELMEKLKQSEKDCKIAQLRALTLNRLNIAFQERTKSQIFYIVTSHAISKDNEFKIGGVENYNLLKKRLSAYNTGVSGVHPDLKMFYVYLVEVANYKQMESRLKEFLSPFRSKIRANTENFNLHFKILKPLVELVAENYNEEINKLNEFVKNLLDTHTEEFIEPEKLQEIDPDNIPAHFDITITKREFGMTKIQKQNVSKLSDDELKLVLVKIIETLTTPMISRRDVEKMLADTFVIDSNKRRIWDFSKSVISDIGKTAKY